MRLDSEVRMNRVRVHPWLWAFLIAALMWAIVIFYGYQLANAQTFVVDRGALNFMVRDMTTEPTTTYLPDSTLNRFINIAQNQTMLALREKTSVIIDTIVTSPSRLRYYLADTKATSDTVMAGRVAMVIQKDATAIGGKERALGYLSPELVGQTMQGPTPGFFTVMDRHLILGESPYGGDTLFAYMGRVPRDLSSATTALTVSKEDQVAVALYASFLVYMRDHQIQMAQRMFEAWQAHVAMKAYPTIDQGRQVTGEGQ